MATIEISPQDRFLLRKVWAQLPQFQRIPLDENPMSQDDYLKLDDLFRRLVEVA